MSMAALFEELGAPLNNVMWSWGSIRNADNAVFLRVWQDGTQKLKHLDGRYYTRVCDVDDSDRSNGANERKEHVKAIENGAQAYLIFCEAEDEGAAPRKVKSYDEELRIGGDLIVYDGAVWIKNVGKKTVSEVRLK